MMIQVTKTATIVAASPGVIDALRAEFECHHFVRIANFLSRELLEIIQNKIDDGQFYERIHTDIGLNRELCLDANAGVGALCLLINDSRLFQFVQRITGCQTIGCFEGRVYRVAAGCGHRDAWHNDIGDHRMVAMSINLSRQPYKGGVLQLRSRATQEIVAEVSNTEPGDAIIFRLSRELEHRITDVEGDAPKTAFAGWFKSEPTFATLLGDRAQQRHTDTPMINCDVTADSTPKFAVFQRN
jgi:2OG-Fe(II) oxygenase superfamily